ncbi:611_t:CDS:2, partial [Gigaspora rosea]
MTTAAPFSGSVPVPNLVDCIYVDASEFGAASNIEHLVTKPFWYKGTMELYISFKHDAKIFMKIFVSQFTSEIGLQLSKMVPQHPPGAYKPWDLLLGTLLIMATTSSCLMACIKARFSDSETIR